jgi:hypothetical protein
MSIPVYVSGLPGQYTAQLVGDAGLAAVGATREDAVTGLRLKVREKLDSGELTTIEVGTWTDLAGEYIDDPTLDLISQEAYEAREVESAE